MHSPVCVWIFLYCNALSLKSIATCGKHFLPPVATSLLQYIPVDDFRKPVFLPVFYCAILEIFWHQWLKYKWLPPIEFYHYSEMTLLAVSIFVCVPVRQILKLDKFLLRFNQAVRKKLYLMIKLKIGKLVALNFASHSFDSLWISHFLPFSFVLFHFLAPSFFVWVWDKRGAIKKACPIRTH